MGNFNLDSVKMMLAKIVSNEFIEIFQSTKQDISLLKKLRTTVLKLQAILNSPVSNLTVGNWLDRLGYAVFEFDQLLRCEFETLAPTSAKVPNFFSSRSKRSHEIIHSEMLKLIQTLQQISSRKQLCELGISTSTTSSVVVDDESCIFGRDNDINKLKHLLLSTDDSKTRIISIVGMGGIGKTALAKVLYNDPEVKDKFGVRGWALVSNDFFVIRVLETILESITSQAISRDNLKPQPRKSLNTKKRNDASDMTTMYRHLLLVKLQQILSTASFLIVLDDVWDAKLVDLILLMNIFGNGETGSRIIITTRDDRVALSIHNFLSIHYLRPLESEDSWSIVSKLAFGASNNQQWSDLEVIGREIAKKCDGLPLASITVATFLCIQLSTDNWNNVLGSDIWELIDYDAQHALQFSYRYLSAPLKRCFAYCSMFPKKSILEKNVVVQCWIAEGLVEELSADQEIVGEEYFDELVSRSLIHRRSIGDEEASFEMHSFVHDLATMVLSPYIMRFEKHSPHERVPIFLYNRGLYDSFNKFDLLSESKGLRTFLALPLQQQQQQLPFCLLSNKVIHDLLPRMKELRVLSLSNYRSITEVPNSIGNLLYLQYLNLSCTKIERLPSETCKLYNLKFLLLSGCKRLSELPEDIGKLIDLQHLDVSDTALREMPVQLAKLVNLQTLSDFSVSKHNGGSNVAELGKFPHLHGKLSISQLQNVNNPFEVVLANMKMKERIDKLALEWNCGSIFSDSQIQSIVLEHLRPSTNLKSLTIKGYGGISFPNWLGESLFSNMVYLKISNCDDCLWLPPLGQLGNLKELIIDGMRSIQTIGTEFYGSDGSLSFQPFPSLEILHFEDMQEWEEWNLIGGTSEEFPCLKTLSLSRCLNLRVGNILEKFPSITKLELRECPQLVQSMPSSDHVFRQPVFLLNSLRKLTIDLFPSPMSFPTVVLPKTLKSLIISNCENLEFLSHEYLHHYTSLEELKIAYSCNSMISFSLGALPVLKSLFIEGCRNLKSILISEDGSQNNLSFLRSIKIWDCNELESFPQGGLHTPNLIYFAVWKCQKLSSLPEAMNTLTDLQEMEIDDLPNLQYFVIDDLPISLRELTVGSVGGIMWNTEPTWQHLTCLSVLRINGNETVNTLMVPLLPASLVTLCIRGLNNTSLDGKWRQHLTSLQNLEIVNAPKLKSLPKKGLPSSLLVLNMTFCPLLKEILRRKRGKEWSKIAHIPAITIDDELIT